jgi:hypothetical protein
MRRRWTKVGYAAAILCIYAIVPYANARAQLPSCVGVSGSKPLFACHAQRRRSYGVDLERRLVGGGEDARVFIEETGEPGGGGYPRLIIWAPIDKGKAYQLNERAWILEGAREVGFKTLVYVDKDENRNWYFNLTKPGSMALDVVPWRPSFWQQRK